MSRKKIKAGGSAEDLQVANAFGALDALGELPTGPEGSLPVITEKTSKRGQKNSNRGRVDVVRQTAHRGGKAVTVAKNFTGIGLAEEDPESLWCGRHGERWLYRNPGRQTRRGEAHLN
jgi:translation initiation factor 1